MSDQSSSVAPADAAASQGKITSQDKYAAYVAIVGVTLHAVYFCVLKQITMMSEMSNYEIMYHRSIWGLGILVFYQVFMRGHEDPVKTSFFSGITPAQLPFVLMRVVGTSLAHLCCAAAMKLIATSKVVLIFENPFLTALIAYAILGEQITKHEIVVFFMATTGIYLLTQGQKSEVKYDESGQNELLGIGLAITASILANLGAIALRQLGTSNPIDSTQISLLICIFGCMFNPIMIAVLRGSGNYKEVSYTEPLLLALFLMAASFVCSTIYVNEMIQIFKASWGRVALNLQIVLTFIFDVFIADVSFSGLELLGCALLICANLYLVLVKLLFSQETPQQVIDRQNYPI